METHFLMFVSLFASLFAFPNEFQKNLGQGVFEEILQVEELFGRLSTKGQFSRGFGRLTGFSYKNCGVANSQVNINSLSITPDPLSFPGVVSVSTSFKVNSDVVTPVKVDLSIYKEVFGKFIKFPCVSHVGSCTYDDFCQLIANVKCPQELINIGINCRCPIKENSYTLPPTGFDINTSDIPSGTYRAIINASTNGTPVICLDITVSVS